MLCRLSSLQVCGMLVWILVGGTDYFHLPALCWVMFVTISFWILTICLFIIDLTRAYNRTPQIPWTTLVTNNYDVQFGSIHLLKSIFLTLSFKCVS